MSLVHEPVDGEFVIQAGDHIFRLDPEFDQEYYERRRAAAYTKWQVAKVGQTFGGRWVGDGSALMLLDAIAEEYFK